MDTNQVNELERYANLDDTSEDRTESICLMCSLWRTPDPILSDSLRFELENEMMFKLHTYKESTVIVEERVTTNDLVASLQWSPQPIE